MTNTNNTQQEAFNDSNYFSHEQLKEMSKSNINKNNKIKTMTNTAGRAVTSTTGKVGLGGLIFGLIAFGLFSNIMSQNKDVTVAPEIDPLAQSRFEIDKSSQLHTLRSEIGTTDKNIATEESTKAQLEIERKDLEIKNLDIAQREAQADGNIVIEQEIKKNLATLISRVESGDLLSPEELANIGKVDMPVENTDVEAEEANEEDTEEVATTNK